MAIWPRQLRRANRGYFLDVCLLPAWQRGNLGGCGNNCFADQSGLLQCSQSPYRRASVGSYQSVVTGSGSPLPVYRDHDANQLRFAQLRPGTIVAVLAGPIYSDGYIWWQIRAPTGISGWVIAFDGQSEMLRSLSNHAP